MTGQSAKIMALAITASVSLATAQQSVLSLPFYGYDTQSVDASVVAADSTATILQLACPSGIDQNDCGLAPSQTLTVGPSTYNMIASEPGEYTASQDCSTMGTTGAVCQETLSGGNDPGASTTTYTSDDVVVIPVEITAGLSKLSTPATVAASTTSGVSLTVLSGTNMPTSSQEDMGGSGTGSAPAETSTGAADANGRGKAVGAVAGLAGLLACAL